MSGKVTRMASEAETALAQAFQTLHADLPGNGEAAGFRAQAFDQFARAGLPTRRIEAWHYTDLRAAMRKAFAIVDVPDAKALGLAKAELAKLAACANRIVLVDGVYQPDLSEAATGLTVTGLEEVLACVDVESAYEIAPHITGGDSAVALNAAMMSGGAVIDIAAHTLLEAPLEIVSIATRSTDAAIFARSMVRAGAGSKATVIERHISAGGAGLQKNDALVVHVGAAANISHAFIAEGPGAGLLHVNSLIATVSGKAQFSSFALLDGGAMVRRQMFVRFTGAQASIGLGGLALVRNKDHADTTLVVEHLHRDCDSKEYFKHIVDGSGTGVFQGKIAVAAEAQKTNGAMKSQAILLSGDAAMYNKPELEIFADDVACGHGATVGSLDPDQLFYAMARGLARRDAEALLLEAFGADAIERVASEALREELTARLRNWLAGRKA